MMIGGRINIVDATPVEAARSGRGERKDGHRPGDPEAGLHVRKDGRGRMKGIYGHPVRTGVDGDGFVHRRTVVPCNVHDGRERDRPPSGDGTAFYADAAYGSRGMRDKPARFGIADRVQGKGRRGHPSGEADKERNAVDPAWRIPPDPCATVGARSDLCRSPVYLREQAPVPDRHNPFESEVPAQFEHLVRNGMGIGVGVGVGGVARIGLDRHRASARGGQDRMDHLGPTAFSVAVVAEAHRRAGAALVTAPAYVGERRLAFPQMVPGEPAFDAPPARERPVHCPVRGVLVGIAQVEFHGQCRGMPQPGLGELRDRMHQAFHDHRHDPVALG